VQDRGGDTAALQEKVEQIVMEKVADAVQKAAEEVPQPAGAGLDEKKAVL